MPQLDIATFPSQIFWLLISFSLLYVGLRWIVLPPIQRFFAERENDIIRQHHEARDLLIKTQEMQIEYEQKLQVAKREAHDLIVTARSLLDSDMIKRERDLNIQFIERLKKAEDQLEVQRAKLIQESDNMAFELAKKITEKLDVEDISLNDYASTLQRDNQQGVH